MQHNLTNTIQTIDRGKITCLDSRKGQIARNKGSSTSSNRQNLAIVGSTDEPLSKEAHARLSVGSFIIPLLSNTATRHPTSRVARSHPVGHGVGRESLPRQRRDDTPAEKIIGRDSTSSSKR